MAKTLRVDIVTPEKVVFTNDAVTMVIARAIDGDIGIMPGHAPLITALDVAPLRIKLEESETQIALCSGFMDVQNNTVTILAGCAELPTEIDIKRAEAAKTRAEDRLKNVTPEIDIERAEAALRRALVRLRVAETSRQ